MAARLPRRDFLKGAAASLVAPALIGPGLLGCDDTPDFEPDESWDAGTVAHLLPTVDHSRVLLKVSFREPLEAPVLRVGSERLPGHRTDSEGRFFAFSAGGLEPDTEYELTLLDEAGGPLCEPWPLRTFPAPHAMPKRFRLLAYTCAGGFDSFFHPVHGRIFQPTAVRQRLLARGLALQPDAVVANGDHVYWDLRGRSAIGLGGSPQAWWAAGRFDRSSRVLGTENEEILKAGFGPQIADLYGTLFRSSPVFFLQDDHDYGDNDEATDELRTFPADGFMRHLSRATQSLYYPELTTARGWAEGYGALRYGKLFEGLLYDCRRELTNASDPATGHGSARFLSPEVEAWLIDRTARGDTTHSAHMPSTPVLWTAGKWGEWYPDGKDETGAIRADAGKPYWPNGWLEQHDRLLVAASRRTDRLPLFVSGDLHATGAGQILRTGDSSLESNPIVSILSGTPGTNGPGWPSRFRGQRPVPSGVVEAEEWVSPVEENGFSTLDFSEDGVRISQYRWTSDLGLDAIASLEPFWVRDLPVPRPG
ncbi:MAG: hypothetical protein OEP95_04595 [Myxococcales bacterium]|nr:hypothetical protein [Myxococcales bacterium]